MIKSCFNDNTRVGECYFGGDNRDYILRQRLLVKLLRYRRLKEIVVLEETRTLQKLMRERE